MVRKRDRFWEYVELLNGKFKCKFCDRKFAGGAPRVKSHLSRIKGCGIDICTKVPEDVRVAATEAILGPNKRAKAEASSGKTEETSLSMHIGREDIMLDKLLVKFMLLNGVDVDVVRSTSFIDFVNAVAEYGSHYKLPCNSVVKTKLVPDLEKEIGEHVTNVKKSWLRTGCTLICDYWVHKGRVFLCIFAYSIEGVVLLNALETLNDGDDGSFFRKEISNFVIQEIGANKVVQRITRSGGEGWRLKIVPNDNQPHPHVYRTICVAYQTQLFFENIYNGIPWIQKTFDQARAVVTNIHKYDVISSSMKQFTNYWGWGLKQSTTNFYSKYNMLQSIMRVESELRLLVSSYEWLLLGFEKDDESGITVGETICSSEFWSEGKEVLHVLEPIFRILCLVDGYGATFGSLYGAVEMADETIRQIYETNVPKYQKFWEFFKQWQRDIIHPLHAAAAFLNPAYMCSKEFIENDAIKHGINIMFEKLVDGEEKEKFVKEMQQYRNKVPKLFTSIAMTMLRTSHPCDWWDYCGDVLPVLKKYAIRVLSQPCSTSFCRQSLSAFQTAWLRESPMLTSMTAVMNDYLYLRTNALLMENFNTIKEKIRKPLDLEKLGELPDFTELMNENFTRDLLNETEVPLPDGQLNCWSASARKDGESEKHLRLHFITKLPSSLIKGDEIMGEKEAPVHVILADSNTGRIVQSGPLSMLELMVTVIEGDFDEEDGKNWTREFFESNELKGQEGNMPLLTGDPFVFLHQGMGTLGAITFNDISSWTRSGKFRLGVKTALGCCEGFHVLEGTSNAFAVEDGRRADPNICLVEIRTAEGSDTSKALTLDDMLIEFFDEEDSTSMDSPQ